MDERLKSQINFLIEIDKMKTILRQTLLVDKSKRENDAEHSWHFAVMAMILFEYNNQVEADILRVLKMALVHDLIEVYAGDTFAYDEKGNETKQERELEAADKIFGLLPGDQRDEMYNLWWEFEKAQTPDAKYATAIDRLQPLINNYMTEGHTWKTGNVTSDKVYKRLEIVKEAAPKLWNLADDMVKSSIEKGYLKK